jgi:hypothetical protein
MAVELLEASSESYYRSASLSGDVFTFAAWVYLTDLTADRTIIAAGDEAETNNNYFQLRYDQSSNDLRFVTRDATTNGIALSTITPAANTWYHVVGSISALNNRDVWVNGGNKGTNTTTLTSWSSTIDNIAVGAYRDSSPGVYLNGSIFMPAVWQGWAAGDDDALAMSKGVPPWKFAPDNLIFFTPLASADGTPRDWISGTALTVTGTPTTTEGPHVQLDGGIIVPERLSTTSTFGFLGGITEPWKQVPPPGTQIDWSNPITADMQILADFADGWPVNRVTNQVGSIGDGSPYVTAQELGMVAHVDEELSPNDIFVLPKIDHAVVGRDELTIFALVKSDSNPVAVDGYAFGYGGTGFDPFYIGESGTDDVECRVTVDGTVYADVLTDGILNGPGAANVWHVIAAKWSATANTLYTYCNKVKSSGTATGGGSVLSGDVSTNNRPCLGANHPTAGSPYTGHIAMCVQWSRELSDAEIFSLVDNPWQLYQPQRTFVVVDGFSTGPVITDVANSGESPGSGTETWPDGSTGNVITGTGFM